MYADYLICICEVPLQILPHVSILMVYLLVNPLAIQYIDMKPLLTFSCLHFQYPNSDFDKFSPINALQFIKFVLLQGIPWWSSG